MIKDKASFLIGEAFDSNLKAYLRHIADDFIEKEGYFRAYSGIKHPNHNIFYQDVIKQDNLEKILDETIEYFSEKGVPFTWWVSDETINENIKKTLTKKLRPYGEMLGLAINLEDLKKGFDKPNALYVDFLKNNANIKEWTRIVAQYFGLRNNDTRLIDDKLEKYDLSDKNLGFKKFMAYLSGEAVAACTMMTGDKVAAIFDDEVIPYYSKYNPFILSIIYYPLKKAIEMGYHVGLGIVDTKRINYYKILGFEERYKYHKFVFVPRRK